MKYENDPSFKLLPAKLVLVACLYPYEPALTRVFIAEKKKKEFSKQTDKLLTPEHH